LPPAAAKPPADAGDARPAGLRGGRGLPGRGPQVGCQVSASVPLLHFFPFPAYVDG
jgi:hypothetical protein